MTSATFFAKMEGFTDELAAAGKTVSDDELVSFILAGLGNGYDSAVAALDVAKKSVTVAKLFSHIQNYDQRQEMLKLTSDGGF
jgi:hypothetical protein